MFLFTPQMPPTVLGQPKASGLELHPDLLPEWQGLQPLGHHSLSPRVPDEEAESEAGAPGLKPAVQCGLLAS